MSQPARRFRQYLRAVTSGYGQSAIQVGRNRPLLVKKSGMDLLQDPLFNKSTAFSAYERDSLHLRGLLPPRLLNLRDQIRHVETRYSQLRNPLDKYEFLMSLRDRSVTLFYRFIADNIKETSRIIYTPTVGQACLQFGNIFRRPRGMYFTAEDRGMMATMVHNWQVDEVDIIVVTDGGRVLGLGDLGAHGMAISMGKLALYVAAGGMHPGRCLPIVLDVGTNNEQLREDPTYLGLKRPRLDGYEYDAIVEEFMEAVFTRWPMALVQFEDFTSSKAYNVLQKYRYTDRCFNDDIQGTGTVILAGLLNTLRAQQLPPSALCSQRIVIAGAGSAGLGVADSIYMGMVHEGMTAEDAAKNFWLIDKDGLIYEGRPQGIPNGCARYMRREPLYSPEKCSMQDVIDSVKPTMLLGLSGVPNVFTEELIRSMSRHVERPVIFPLSNPTSKAECSAENVYRWSDGRAFFASGSPFEDVILDDGRLCVANQGNNMYIFPGVGLGATLSKTRIISDEMFYSACKALSLFVSEDDLRKGVIFPKIEDIRRVSARIGAAVFEKAVEQNLCTDRELLRHIEENDMTILDYVEANMYEPYYQPMCLV